MSTTSLRILTEKTNRKIISDFSVHPKLMEERNNEDDGYKF